MATPATHIWRPSHARYLEIDGFVPLARGPVVPPPLPPIWPQKDPGDTLDYIFDIAPALTANPGDGISTLDVTISPANAGDLTLASSGADGARAVLWLTAGQAGTVYTVTLSMTTSAGRTIVRSIALPVVSLSTVPVTVETLTTQTGLVLTDALGNPLTF
ncbi:hypothetical protein [Acidocella sp.]|uniref:phage fiber-tail adaptor protein n=1 Tax=Acidocella sp. TaxID=50710 RepID=UPI002609A0BB|nr:hypothetical protein [Acidocella sp.]